MDVHLYTIHLLGVSLTVKTTEDIDYLRKLEKSLLDATVDVQENLGIQDPISVAIMAGFFLSDQLHKKEDLSVDSREERMIQDKILRMSKLMDRILK
ncbi:cell division protein ZapA [Entomospira culicis]|uniref:Cell division protein ZapA n=1 Tax=Entomospira culicis TaxID=2719989 RepID=A0A968KUF3_9SPIO|nr:cell division protein ZapA [Entomospira culicis]NIZ18850.1 cell division protein ZapA [Entomospira culicis]NIZ69065.1 cell division protein ZapA [Entomospira culicis]WDI37653.1 cell division protein ZapA [Entomospira culicis]WDI39281.1 cell division protein ZapA [Entomospira culicis]